MMIWLFLSLPTLAALEETLSRHLSMTHRCGSAFSGAEPHSNWYSDHFATQSKSDIFFSAPHEASSPKWSEQASKKASLICWKVSSCYQVCLNGCGYCSIPGYPNIVDHWHGTLSCDIAKIVVSATSSVSRNDGMTMEFWSISVDAAMANWQKVSSVRALLIPSRPLRLESDAWVPRSSVRSKFKILAISCHGVKCGKKLVGAVLLSS